MKKHWAAGILAIAALGGVLFYGRRGPAVPAPVVFRGLGGVEKIVLSPDGRLLAEDSRQGQVLVYDTEMGTQKFAVPIRTDWIAFSPDGKRLLTVDQQRSTSVTGGIVQVWDTATGAQTARFAAPPAPPGASAAGQAGIAAVSPDLRRVVARAPQRLGVYDIGTGKLVKAFPSAVAHPNSAFSPDGRLFAIGIESGAGSLRVWNTQTWQPVPGLNGLVTKVSGIRFSPDGTRLALGSSDGLTWWDTRTGKQQGQFVLPSPSGLGRGFYRFSSDSRSLLVTGMNPDWMLHEIDCATGRETLTVPRQLIQRTSLAGNRFSTVAEAQPYQVLFFQETYCLWDAGRHKLLRQITIPPRPNSPWTGDFQMHTQDLSDDGHVFAVGGCEDGIIRVWRLP